MTNKIDEEIMCEEHPHKKAEYHISSWFVNGKPIPLCAFCAENEKSYLYGGARIITKMTDKD